MKQGERRTGDLLNQPIKLNRLTLRSRIVMTAIHTGFAPEGETEFLAERARGGAAAVTAVMGVNPEGTSGNMTMISQETAEVIRTMAKRVEAEGACLFIQLFHAGRNGRLGEMKDPQAVPVAPSQVPSPIYRQVPRVLSTEEITETVKDFAKAAAVCRDAGVHGVEISCSAGYLLSQFLSPLTNQREDLYGGSEEKRFRFPLEVAEAVRTAVGPDYPVTIRISSADMLGGYGIEEMKRFLRKAEPFLDGIDVTGGWHESPIPQITMQVPEGGFAYLAREIKRTVSVPVIACNRINRREAAEAVLEGGYGDLVGCARAFLADAEFAAHVLEGRPHRRCIGCNKGCIDRVLKQQTVSCVFNPRIRRFETMGEGGVRAEKEMDPPFAGSDPSQKSKKVLVAGGGPAGMEAAKQAAALGARVILCEAAQRLGGALWVAGKAPNKEAIWDNITAMAREVEDAGVEVRLGTAVNRTLIEEERPELVILAVGGTPTVPSIPGVQGQNVITAQALLAREDEENRQLLTGRVCVIGGGAVGLETALYLARLDQPKGRSLDFLDQFAQPELRPWITAASGVCVVEMADKVGRDLGSLRHIVLKELKRAGVEIRTGAAVKRISEGEIEVEQKSGADSAELQRIPADTIVLAVGSSPRGAEMMRQLEGTDGVKLVVIGDAAQSGTVQSALEDAFSNRIFNR